MDIANLAGRIIVGLYFLVNAYSHLFQSSHMMGYAASKGVPNPRAAILGSGALLLIGGLSLLFNFAVAWGITCLLLFMIPVTFIMHNFWNEADPSAKMNEKISFMKNMAIIGFLLMVISVYRF